MNESIIVGVVVGASVAVIGALVGHFLRLREMDQHWDKEQRRMEALWAEEERRRKSDRRRELYERDLRIVADTVNALVGVVDRIEWSAGTNLSPDERLALGIEAHLMAGRANLITLSLDDQRLDENLHRLIRVFNRWTDLVDLDTGEPYEGTEEEFQELQEEIRRTGAEVLRRKREILEEV